MITPDQHSSSQRFILTCMQTCMRALVSIIFFIKEEQKLSEFTKHLGVTGIPQYELSNREFNIF